MLRLSLNGGIFVASETFKLPADPFPILAKATGNMDLQIGDLGKMAATVNKIGLASSRTTAMRIFPHLAKTLRYPTLHAWFMKLAKSLSPGLSPNSLRPGESVYSWELMEKAVLEMPCKNITNTGRLSRGFHPKRDAEILCKPALSLPFPWNLPLIDNPPSEDLLCP